MTLDSSGMTSARAWLRLMMACLAIITASGGDAERFGPPARLTLPAEAVIASLGELSDSTRARELAMPWVAALSPSMRYVAVGDRASAPFIHVLDRQTDEAWSFGTMGDGPGELRRADALAFLNDSTLLVLSDHRLERYAVSGEWRNGYRVADAGLFISSITTGCDGRVFAYGVPLPHRSTGRPDTLAWLHELDLDETISAQERMRIPSPPGAMSWGALYGFDGSADGVVLYHKPTSVGHWYPCNDSDGSEWSRPPGRTDEDQAATTNHGMVLTLPDTMFAGAAARGPVKVWARSWKDGGADVTALREVTDSVCREVELVGLWTLHDAHAVGLVLTFNEPFPAAKIIDWNWFQAQLTPVRCAV